MIYLRVCYQLDHRKMDTQEYFWLVGLLEGEGSFLRGSPSCPNRPRISLQITDGDVADRAALLMGAKRGIKYSRNPRHKPVFQVVVSGTRAVALMEKLRPQMGSRRQSQIDAAISCFEDRRKRLETSDLEKIRSYARYGGLTQSEIATKFGIRRETVNKIVNRKGSYRSR